MARSGGRSKLAIILAIIEVVVKHGDKVGEGLGSILNTIRRGRKRISEAENERVVDAVVASRFVLRDSKNQVRAELSVVDDAPTLQLCDESGEPRIVLRVDSDQGATVALFDGTGQLRISMACDEEGPAVAVHDAEGEGRVGMTVFDRDGAHGAARTCAMTVRNAGSESGILMMAGDSAEIAVTAGEETAASLQLGPDGLVISDRQEKERMVFGLGENGSPEIRIVDDDGSAIWSIPRRAGSSQEGA